MRTRSRSESEARRVGRRRAKERTGDAPAALALIVLGIITMSLGGCATRMATIGLENGALRPCPESPNCVSSLSTDAVHGIEVLTYNGDEQEGMRLLKAAMERLPRTRIVKEDGRYLHVEFTTRIMRFVDDVEFLIAEGGGKIDVRSASRVGYGDMGTNRKRVEEIRAALAELSE